MLRAARAGCRSALSAWEKVWARRGRRRGAQGSALPGRRREKAVYSSYTPLAVYSAHCPGWHNPRLGRDGNRPGANRYPARQADPDNAEHVALGQQVYASFCAGCHGGNLEGQPNWRQRLPLGNFPAPPHDETGHTWHHADQWLFEIVKYGGKYHAPTRYRSAMSAYQEMLSDAEIWAVLAFIKSRWPAAIRAQQEQQNAGNR